MVKVISVNGKIPLVNGKAIKAQDGGATEPYVEETYDSSGNLTAAVMHGYLVVRPHMFYNCNSLASVTFNSTPSSISSTAFNGCPNLTTINVPWAAGAVSGAPWGATNATINYNHTGA